MPESVENICAVCNIPAKQKCAACKLVYYCGRDHQKSDWKKHSAKCKCYKLEKNEKLGRHYVALRRIEAGEIVIKEYQALVQGPQQDSVPVCLACCTPLTTESAKPCNECGWPLCNICTNHASECEFTKKYKDSKVSISGFGMTHPTYKCITVIRALALKNNNPEAYDKLMKLSSECDDFEEPRDIARFIKRFFNKLDDFSEEEITRIVGILQINGHEVPFTEPAQIAVYDESSYLEHSCRANCSKSFMESGGIVIRAAVKIEKGEHLTICYTDPLWGTANRRHHLKRTKFFDCTCSRCSDPTEFGTMFDALKCTKTDCSGYMLPETFIANEIPDYKCKKCSNLISSKEADDLMEQIGKDLLSMKKNDPHACRDFINKYSSKLHDNHYYMTDIKLALAQMIGQQKNAMLTSLDDEVISEKILLCKKMNDLLKVLVPAENRVRGLILFEMHAAVAEFGRRQDKSNLYGILQESKKMLNESYELLKDEPEILPEGKIARTAKQNLREMDIIMQKLCENAVTPL